MGITVKLRENQKMKLSLFTVGILVGLMVTIQYTGSKNRPVPVSTDKLELNTELAAQLDQSQLLYKKVDDLESQITQLKLSQGNASELRSELQNELDQVKREAALTSLSGPGITMKLTLSKSLYNNLVVLGVDPHSLVLNEDQLREIVSDLFASGAQGIAINGHRISSYSTIRPIGSQDNQEMQINGRPVTEPYTFQVIGDVNKLNAGILSYQLEDNLHKIAYEMTVDTFDSETGLTIPAYQEGIEIKYAHVDAQGVAK